MTETISIRPLETWKTAPDAPCSPGSTWHVLAKYQDIDLEMWVCWLLTPENPDGEVATCYAWAVQDMATRQEEHQ